MVRIASKERSQDGTHRRIWGFGVIEHLDERGDAEGVGEEDHLCVEVSFLSRSVEM